MAISVVCQCGAKFPAKDQAAGRMTKCPNCGGELKIEGERIPNHEVFVSYSSKDKVIADAVCAALENGRLRCWVAPRDITPGSEWGSSILDAIAESRVMVLVFSQNANISKHVVREVEAAVARGVAILPLRVEDVAPSKNMEYFIKVAHWLDAMTPPLESHLEGLCSAVRALLHGPSGAVSTRATAQSPSDARREAVGVAEQMPDTEEAPAKVVRLIRQQPRRRIAVLSAFACALIVVSIEVYRWPGSRPTNDQGATVAPAAADNDAPNLAESISRTATSHAGSAPVGIEPDHAPPMFVGGTFTVTNDELVKSDAGKAEVLFGSYAWVDYDFSFDFMRTNDKCVIKAYVCANAEKTNRREFWYGYATNDNGCNLIEVYNNKEEWAFGGGTRARVLHDQVEQKLRGAMSVGRWHNMRLEVRESTVRCIIDGVPIITRKDGRFGGGRVGIGCSKNASFKNIRVTSADGTVLWNDLPRPP